MLKQSLLQVIDMKKLIVVLSGVTIASTSFGQILIDAKAGHSYGYVSKNKDLGFQSNSVEIGGQYLFENLHIPVGLGLTISRSQYTQSRDSGCFGDKISL